MELQFENFAIWFDDTLEDERPCMVACRNRLNYVDEEWMLASLNVEEATKVYELLKEYLNK